MSQTGGEFRLNQERLAKLRKNTNQVRTGGAGSQRRKKKAVRKNAGGDDQKLQLILKRSGCNQIQVDEVNIIKGDGNVVQFRNPRVQLSMNSNLYAVTGNPKDTTVTEILPDLLSSLGTDFDLSKLQNMQGGDADDEIPDLMDANFEDFADE
eukprot:TRINITY_DN12311_c0_g1_i1.p1 TRINITY_DN12311_c0_g1~~TRINITY_DN12311_c0_g1_i1.p1  ORF type:complete len:159 (-),score=52.04 TRINITY_DN12311_c0_g1_i1:67-522(-)